MEAHLQVSKSSQMDGTASHRLGTSYGHAESGPKVLARTGAVGTIDEVSRHQVDGLDETDGDLVRSVEIVANVETRTRCCLEPP